MHIHWHKTVSIREFETMGHLTIYRTLKCRCGRVKTRMQVL